MRTWFAAALAMCVLGLSSVTWASGRDALDWRTLPPLSTLDEAGGAEPHLAFVGIHGGVLILAGGRDGVGTPCDEIYVLREAKEGRPEVLPDGRPAVGGARYAWSKVGATLPEQVASGTSVCTPAGVVCIDHGIPPTDDLPGRGVALLAFNAKAGDVEVQRLSDLPLPFVDCAACVGDILYVFGGATSDGFWALDLTPRDGEALAHRQWVPLDAHGGPPRVGRSCGVLGGKLYVFGGLNADSLGSSARARPPLDAYCFTPARGGQGALTGVWKRIADVPGLVFDAPAHPMGQSHLLAFNGNEVLAYHTITDTWRTIGDMPEPPFGGAVFDWAGRTVLASSDEDGMSLRVVRPAPRQVSFGVANWAALAVYLAVLVGMGFYFSRREKSTDDFFRAGRRVPWWAAGLSLFGTGLSAITFMSIPARAYATNWTYILTMLVPLAVVPVIIVFYIPFYRRLNVTSAYEYLERRFNLPVRLAGSGLFILAQFGRMGIVLFLPAIALTTVTGINVYLCIALMGVLCTLYTVLGGIEAVIWSDVLQVVVLMGAAVLSLVMILGGIDGGVGAAIDVAAADGKFTAFNRSWDYTSGTVWVIVVGTLFSAMMQTSDQSVVQRYLTTPDERAAKHALVTTSVAGIFAAGLFFSLGTALYVFFKAHPDLLDPTIPNDNEAILPLFIMRRLPAGVAGLAVAGIFAASMSSLDSSVNSVATAVTTDFYRRFRPDVADRQALRFARWLTALLGVFGTGAALLVASLDVDSLWALFLRIAGLFGGGLAGLYALGIFTRRAHGVGALVGIVVSAGAVLLVQLCTKVSFFLYAGIGIVTCFVVGYLASLAVRVRPKPIDGLTYDSLASNSES